jgi:Flp pilus assembly protein TadB
MINRNDRKGTRIIRQLVASYQRPTIPENHRSVPESLALSRLLTQAHVSKQVLRQRTLLATAAGLVVWVVLGGKAAAVSWALGGLGVFISVWQKARSHERDIERDLPALLTSIASSVRAGIDPLAAVIAAHEYLPRGSILSKELEQVGHALSEGRDEEMVLEQFLAVYRNQEAELFKRCLILSRRHGGSLAESLHRITKVARQRQSFRRKTRAALAMHRMSAIGIALCAGAMATLQLTMNPRSVDLAVSHPVGGKLLAVGGALIALGIIWMMMMGREVSRR